jgi:hypothetical protein
MIKKNIVLLTLLPLFFLQSFPSQATFSLSEWVTNLKNWLSDKDNTPTLIFTTGVGLIALSVLLMNKRTGIQKKHPKPGPTSPVVNNTTVPPEIDSNTLIRKGESPKIDSNTLIPTGKEEIDHELVSSAANDLQYALKQTQKLYSRSITNNDGTETLIVQIAVSHQGANNTCGQNALKNAITFWNLAKFKHPDILQSQTLFENSNYTTDLVNKWKKDTENNRQQYVLEKEIKKILQSEIKILGSTKYEWLTTPVIKTLKLVLKDEIAPLAYGISNAIIATKKVSGLIKTGLTTTDVIYYFTRKKETLITKLNTLLTLQKLPEIKTEILSSYFASVSNYVPWTETGEPIELYQYIDQYVKEQYGNNANELLEGNEIQHSLYSECNLHHERNNFTILDSVDQLTTNVPCEFLVEWQSTENKKNVSLNIILGTMDQTTKSSGHWFTLCVQKHEGKKSAWIADSLNVDRTSDSRVATILAKINDKKTLLDKLEQIAH